MKKIVVGFMVALAVGSATICQADGVVIPFSIKVNSFKKHMKEKGMDLYGGDDADGEIQNMGTSMKVITYRPATIEQMDLIKEIAVKDRRG